MQISSTLSQLSTNTSADEIQHALYDIARPIPRYQDHSAKGATATRPGVSNEFFNLVYAVLLGESQGPRLGSFIAIYGLEETRALIDRALAGELLRESNDALLARRDPVSEAGGAKRS
jgi:lysyl-tRNA synthetase, class I